jgi:hypothetical protein
MHRWLVSGVAVSVVALTGLLPLRGRAAEQIGVRAQDTDEPGAFVIEASAILDVSPWGVRHVLLHECDFRHRFAYMSECRLLGSEGHTQWQYSVVSPPRVSARGYAIRKTLVQDLRPDGTGTFQLEWHKDDSRGPPPQRGVIRLVVNEGMWSIRGLGQGMRTHLGYRVKTAPGGNLPLWIARLSAQRAIEEQGRRIEATAKDVVGQSPGPP